METTGYEVIIIGGSYAGLSAAMALGRSMRKVLVIDSGQPCNWQTPHAHNLITQDGETPQEIARKAREQVMLYPTVTFLSGLAAEVKKLEQGFEVSTLEGGHFTAGKLLFTTGIKDIPMDIPGYAECWGKTVIHCPYCHGYEVKDQTLGIIGNGDGGFEFGKSISHWSKDLKIFTNGKSTITKDQSELLLKKGITIIEDKIASIAHQDGYMSGLNLEGGKFAPLKAVFSSGPIEGHSKIPERLGCEILEEGMLCGLIKVDEFCKTTVKGVYAAGDNCTPYRSLSSAIAAGSKTGSFINNDLISEEFDKGSNESH